MPRAFRTLLVPVLLVLILATFLGAAHSRRLVIPVPVTDGDQESYLRYARRMKERNYDYVGGRNRMPIYPFLLSLLYRPEMSEDEFLKRAQSFNVNLSAAVLLGLFFVYRRYLPALFSVALVAGTAFGAFLTRAVRAQVEVLFYFAFFLLFLALCHLLVRPRVALGLLAGALAGVTFLLKASVLPVLAIFSSIFAVRTVWQRGSGRWLGEVASLAGVIVLFLAVVFPYISTSKRVYGQYFYNVNSTFYFWTDSWPEARAFSKRSGDLDHWPAVPPEEIPSPGKYWREHSLGQIASRLFGGMAELATHNARLDGYYKYVVLLLGGALFVAWRERERFLPWLKQRAFPAAFAAVFFAVFYSLFAWYAPLSADSRFVLTLFLPVTFTAAYVIMRFEPPSRPLVPIFSGILFFFAFSDAVHRILQLR
ncbi:MAG TPA: hypothetical protein VG095_00505 [Chthoniobacterales bacterium]|nr:hypothetical protein [Chthoniobacterales bacterium]